MNLIVKGDDPDTRVLKTLAKLSGARAIEQITPASFRLVDASPAEGIAELCAQQGLDWSFVEAG